MTAYCTRRAGLPGCARGRPRARHSPAPRELCRRIPRAGVCALPRRAARRPHRQSRYSLQSRDQVRRRAALCAAPGRCWFATGHYAVSCAARRASSSTRRATVSKDQSYFLHAVARRQLERTLMPLGEIAKTEVRERARRAGLPVFDKPDSTGICFIGERPFREFLVALPAARRPGAIETPEGVQLGTHRGLAFYTLGQRAGLRSAAGAATRRRRGLSLPRTPRVMYSSSFRGTTIPSCRAAALATGVVHWLTEPPRDRISRSGQGALPSGRSDGAGRDRWRRHGAHSFR